VAQQSNYQDVVVVSSNSITIGGEALILGTDAGSKSLVFAQDPAQASALFVVASNPSSQATQILPFANGTIGLITAISAGVAAVSNGQIVLSNSNNFSFGINGSTLTASAGTTGITGLGVSNVGNTLGNTGTTFGQIVFAGAGNITLSQVTSAGSLATITISGGGGGGGGVAVSAGAQSTNGGTVVFSNSNLVSFGMSNSSVVTASVGYAQGVSNVGNTEGTTGTTYGTIVFAGIGGIILSQSTAAGSLATISISAAVESGVGVSAGTASATNGTIVFSNSNSLSFGLNGSTVTASFDPNALIAAYVMRMVPQ
jgi:hypothetical protein